MSWMLPRRPQTLPSAAHSGSPVVLTQRSRPQALV